jgi:hypothetical protein
VGVYWERFVTVETLSFILVITAEVICHHIASRFIIDPISRRIPNQSSVYSNVE